MNKILIIAHAPLAQALRECALHVFPCCAGQVLALDVQANAAPEDTFNAACQLAQDMPGNLLVLTDLFGATPSNVAQRLVRLCAAQGRQVREVTGVNLPMLLRLVCHSGLPFEALEQCAVTGGTQGIFAVDISSGAPACTLLAAAPDQPPTSESLF